MKHRIGIILGCLACAAAVHAEATHSVGLQLGFDRQLYRLNAPSRFEEDKTKLDITQLNGAKIGFVYETAWECGVGIFTAINYSFTGHRRPWEEYAYTPAGEPTPYKLFEYSAKSEAHTLELNLEAEYKWEIAGNTYLIFHTGPSFQGIAKYEAKDFFRLKGSEEEQTMPVHVFGYNAEDMAQWYKRWNITWGIGAGFQYKRYFIRGGYNFGLVNPYKIQTFGAAGFEAVGSHELDDRITRGRFDNWCVKLGIFLWDSDN